MNRTACSLAATGFLLMAGCAANVPHTVPEFRERSASPAIVGDGLEVRVYPLRSDRDEVRRALNGLGARLASSNALVLRGLEYYEFDLDRLEDLVDVVSNENPSSVRWIGQSFTWQNLMPERVPVDSQQAWLALPGRTWSTMMEDGPVVYVESMPLIGYDRLVGSESRVELVREQGLRMESILRHGRCLVLIGGDGLPVVENEAEGIPSGDETRTLGGALLAQTVDSDAEESDFLVFIPHFTPGRLRPLRPGPFERAERQPES
ncbi:MAG: hypothetical protein CMJ41_02060 [Phycisphaerae bacterium]|nr:hypothetical protein [Phycisphaerae bacterium]HBZ96420.1 hypothetical protein [Phycisphaerales bacterium]